MRNKFIALFILLSFALPFTAIAKETNVKITNAERKMAKAITADQIREFLYFVASDEMGGRDTPSRGLDLTAKFLALNLHRWGFKPAGDDGSFFQKMTIQKTSIDKKNTKVTFGGNDFALTKDFFLLTGSGSVDGGLVFGGDGWMVKAKGIDAFAGVDVRGKVVVLKTGGFGGRRFPPPKGVTDADLKGEKGVDWADPVAYAEQKGARAILLLANNRVQGFWPRLANFLGRGSMYVEGLREGRSGSAGLPMLLISQPMEKAIFEGASGDGSSSAAFEVGKEIRINAVSKNEKMTTQNVVALWEGRDPKLRSEMVAIGAHYDHVGTRPNARGDDKIWNGADDDGSGTVAVLAIAEALSKAPRRPKRSVLLVWHAGEEKGLWGSEYFNKFPTVDIKKVVAQLNIDMIGRSKKADDTNPKNKELSGENEIYVIGAEMMSSALGSVTKETNSSYLGLTYNYRYDDPKDPNRFFFRSDHFNYAVNGIPIVFWFDGVHEDYHGAGDSPDKIDYAKMEKVTRTIFLTLWELSEMKNRPLVDKELPKELTRRN